MKKSRSTVGDLCRQHGIREATPYTKYGATTVPEARRLKVPEEENRKLTKLLAEAMPDDAALESFWHARASR